MTVPDLEDDCLALVLGQFGQRAHGLAFRSTFIGAPFEPANRFPLTGQPAPEAAPVIECAVAEGAHAIVLGSIGALRQFQQGDERFLQNVLRLAMTQAQGASINNQFRRLFLVKRLAPAWLVFVTHVRCKSYLLDTSLRPFCITDYCGWRARGQLPWLTWAGARLWPGQGDPDRHCRIGRCPAPLSARSAGREAARVPNGHPQNLA